MNGATVITEEQRRAWLRDIDAAECRRSFATFFRRGWHVVEGTQLLWGQHLQLQCDVAQAFGEGWLVAHGRGTPGMVARQDGYWRAHGVDRIPGELLVDHLVVNGGPGTLKSRIWMVYFQAWVWLFEPAATFACTSGTGKNVSRDSAHAEQLIKSKWYRETFRISWQVGIDSSGKQIDSTERWVNSSGGERLSMIWCSDWSGVHVDFLLGDDPNDAKKVWSAAEREEKQETYDKAMGNRLKLVSATMMLQQHVYVTDLTSVLKQRGAGDTKDERERAKRCGSWSINNRKQWAAFVLPVEYNPDKPTWTPWGLGDWRTKRGEVLFAAQWTPDYIASEIQRLLPSGWAAQGNQDPENTGGGEVDRTWFGFCSIQGDPQPIRARPKGCARRSEADGGDEKLPVKEATVIRRRPDGRLDLDWLEIHVDPKNGSQRKKSSRVGIVLVGGKGNQRFILDDRTDRLRFLGTIDALREMIIDWAPHGLTAAVVEFKAQGEAVIATLKREIERGDIIDRNGRRVVIAIEDAEGGSTPFEQRFNAALPTYRAGLICVLDGAGWAEEHIEETCGVPNGAFDDRPDAVCQAINRHAPVARRPRLLVTGGIISVEDADRRLGAGA